MARKPKSDLQPTARDIGYGRPPTEHRFKPGVSGNPTGRPKGSPTVHDLLAREARRSVKIKTAEGIKTVPKLEALVRKLYALALEGDLAAARLIVQSTPANSSEKDAAGGVVADPIDASKLSDEALKRMLARFEGLFSKGKPE